MAIETSAHAVELDNEAAPGVSPQTASVSVQGQPASRANALRRAGQWEVAGTALVAKLLIIIFAAESYIVLANEPIHGLNGWLATLNRWDTVHYLDIAENGYGGSGPSRNLLAFFPAYPWAVRCFSLVFQDYLISGLIVSGVASIIAAILLYRLTILDFSSLLARRATWFLLIFPTSYFLHFAYPESMFLALVLGCILAARTGRWADCGITGALAGLARINGLVLIPVVAYEAAEPYSKPWRFLCCLSPGLGFAGYLLVNLRATGDPVAFLAIQREHWYKHLAVPWAGISQTLSSMRWRPAAESQMIGTQELIFITLGLICTIYCWVKLRRSYAIWMTGNWLLFTCTSFIYSVPRYTLTMFPIYIVFARLGRNNLWSAVIALWSLLFLSLFTGLFVRGQWAF